ncbi:hypothetical protein ACWG0P_05175 [Amedibacillus sp. YH-ame6]
MKNKTKQIVSNNKFSVTVINKDDFNKLHYFFYNISLFTNYDFIY